MTTTWTLAGYSLTIVAGALLGAAVPYVRQAGNRLSLMLAFAAGVMFGAAFFHLLPEAFHAGGVSVFSFAPLGFLFLFLLERFVLAHVCEEPPECEEHAHGGALGLAAFIGLSVHTLFDGVALGSAVEEGVGFMAFIAIVSHKVPSSLSLAAILRSEGKGRGAALLYAAVFGLMVPLGAAAYFGIRGLVQMESFSPKALAFSAGSFLYIAVSDLLPRVNRHGNGQRLKNVAAMVAGLALMLGMTFLAEHRH